MVAVGYIRVSTEDQTNNGVSLDVQRQKITDYCRLNDLDLTEIIEDAGLSGKSVDGRPGIQRAIELACSGDVHAVVVYKLDRLARNTIECLEISQRFDSCGASLHSICEKLDTSTAMGRFFFTLTASLAEMERGIISERTKVALAHVQSAGRKLGRPPYGWAARDGALVPVEDEQVIIERVHMLRRFGGMGCTDIAYALSASGSRTRKGTPWSGKQVQRILDANG